MTYQVRAYAAHSPTSTLSLFQLDRRSARTDDVVIDILFCGVCHSDLHNLRNDWGNALYPMVPGHEIVGRVVGVGSQVTRFKLGDPIAVGCLVDSCRHCHPCEENLEQYCENGRTDTYNSVDRHDGTRTQGGYSEKIVVSQDFVLRVSEWYLMAYQPIAQSEFLGPLCLFMADFRRTINYQFDIALCP
jgi:uncharacterized zinc-type alcohol dehydrogenase-like protein